MRQYFKKIIWTRDRVDHISRHGIGLDEVEEAVFDDPYCVVRQGGRALRSPEENVYFVYGVTMSGTFLFVVLVGRPGSMVFPATARKMTASEKRLYMRRKGE